MCATVHPRMGRRGVGQRVNGIDRRPQLATGDERPNFFAEFACQRRLECRVARTQRRAGERQPLLHDCGDEHFALGPAEHGDRHMAPVRGEAGDIARQIVAPDHVEHHVAAAAAGDPLHLGHEVLGPVVDGVIRTEFARTRTLSRATGGNDHG